MDYAGILHVYGPAQWHDDAFIVGTEDALVALRDALTAAIETGRGACLSFTNDGEGFAAIILKGDQVQIDRLALPYTDKVARENRDGLSHPAILLVREEYSALIGRAIDPDRSGGDG